MQLDHTESDLTDLASTSNSCNGKEVGYIATLWCVYSQVSVTVMGCPDLDATNFPRSLGFSVCLCLCLICIASYFCSLAMHTITGGKALETRQIYSVSGHPLT